MPLDRRSLGTALVLLGSLSTLVGCGGGSGGAFTPKNPFPSRATIEKLAATPPKVAAPKNVTVAPSWRFDPSAPIETQPPVEERGRAMVGNALKSTPEMRCVARELARFYAETGNYPDERLRRFMLGACGSTTSAIYTNAWTWTAPAEIKDEQLVEGWKAKADIPPAVRGGDTGFYLARKGDRAVLMMAISKKASELAVSPVDPETNRVVLRGVVGADTEDASAHVNRGKSDVARCERDPSTALPEVAFACVLAPEDQFAWIEVGTRARGRLLSRSAATILARRNPAAPIEYTTSPHEAAPNGDVVASVLGAVNRARAGANRGPLTLAQKQSAFNAKLAPHLVAAELQGDGETSDMIALGLLAGYDVDGTIKNGDFFFANVSGTSDVSHWLDYALDMPLGRSTLLDPNARQLAVGSFEGSGIGAVVTTYAFFDPNEQHDADAARVIDRITRSRAAKGLPPPTVLGRLPGLAQQAKLVNASQREPLVALDNALATDTQRLGRSLRGWAFAGNDIDAIQLPAEVLAPGPVSISVEVTHWKAEGAAWGSYLVYVVMPVATPQQTARASTKTAVP